MIEPTPLVGGDSAQVAVLLAEEVSRHFGGGQVQAIEKMIGGASRETWSFELLQADGTRRGLILRRDPGHSEAGSQSGWRSGKTAYSLDRTTEAELQRVVYEADGLVAKVHFALPKDHSLGECYVMDRIEGEVLAPHILRDAALADARTMMARQCGQILARLHAVDVNTLPQGLVQMPVDQLISYYRELLDGISEFYRTETAVGRGEYHPAFELAFRWLERNIPKHRAVGLVHGDFRNGNLVVGPQGIRAVLDWELAHIGDGMEDLGWLCVRSWRFGKNANPVGGFGQRDDLFAGYEDAGGGIVDPKSVHFWEVFGTLKWGIICMFQAYKHLSGLIDSFEHMAIGRRACETEIDLLQLIEEA